MGLLPPILIGAFLIVAFALSAQQRLAIASHNGPMPARQIAYQMRVHHEAAIRLKQANHGLNTITDALNDGDFQFLSCIQGNDVATVMMTITGTMEIPYLMVGTAEANAVVQELARQSVIAPELGRLGQAGLSVGSSGVPTAMITPIAGIGVADGLSISTTTGPISMPTGCLTPFGAPMIITQVLP